MNTQGECLQKIPDEFLLKLQSLVEIATITPIILIKAYMLFFYVIIRSRRKLNMLKMFYSRCNGSISSDNECKECIDTVTTLACKVRDCLIKSSRLCSSTILFFPFQKVIHNATVDWDDFVEDCSISQDIEIHALLSELTQYA
jgi:hypothetical protein